jgi:uncharacterized membrane protein
MNYTHSLKAGGLWLALFGIVISMMFLPLITPWLGGFLFGAALPAVVWFITQNKYFHVKPNALMFAALATWFFSFLIGYVKKVQKAREDPTGNKTDASLYYSLMALFFVVMMVLVAPKVMGDSLHLMKNSQNVYASATAPSINLMR